MRREIDLAEVSDGKLYGQNDMVKAGCDDCKGCSSCCREMGASVILDPFDIYMLCRGLGQGFEELLFYSLELNIVDRVILPNLKMEGEEEKCVYLNEEGRCSVHGFRPGFCRMFPLGRIYEGEDFRYFLQVHECSKEPKTKVKISKWIGIPQIKKYESFVKQWHSFLKKAEKVLESFESEESVKQTSMFILKNFYLEPYNTEEDFYPQFEKRMEKAKAYFF